MNNLIIRHGTFADVSALVDSNIDLARETEQLELSPETVRRGVENLLHDSQRGFYLVAERAQKIAGSLMITFEWSDWRNANFWWIQSVYVQEKYRQQGIYRELYQHVRKQAINAGDVCALRLYVEKENQSAQRAYARLGMTESCYKIYEAGVMES
ncbi:MAG: GNAT family N-acetyltransferase [Verrucomicrobiota bacterium]